VEHKGSVIRFRCLWVVFGLFSVTSPALRFDSGVSRLEYALFLDLPASLKASGRPLVLREAFHEATGDQIFREDDQRAGGHR